MAEKSKNAINLKVPNASTTLTVTVDNGSATVAPIYPD